MITYINYTAGTNKGETVQGDLFNNPFKLGEVDVNYTANAVVEPLNAGTGNVLAWTPVVKGAFRDPDTLQVLGDVKVGNTYLFYKPEDGKLYEEDTYTTEYSATAGDKAAYKYDNVVIPQNDLPILNAEMKSIPLIAKARRIAVYYSQIAAYQTKTDYGFDLGDQLAEQAVGRLSYEIDTEIVQLLDTTAGAALPELTWSKTLPIGVNKRDHYFGFLEMVELARKEIYNKTRRFAPNYMVCASEVLPVLTFIDSFKAAPAGEVNGPYFAGTLGALKVFISPALEEGKYLVGVNGSDMMSSVAVYAPLKNCTFIV